MSRSLLMMGFCCSGSRLVQIGAAYMQHQPIDGQAVRTVQIKVRPHSNAHSCKKSKKNYYDSVFGSSLGNARLL